MGKRKGKKRLSRRARQEIREAADKRQTKDPNHAREAHRRKQRTEELIAYQLKRSACLDDEPTAPQLHWGTLSRDIQTRFRRLAADAWEKRPGLLDSHYRVGLLTLSLVGHDKHNTEWNPPGRGLSIAFRSLVTQRLGGYRANVNLIDSLLVDHNNKNDAFTTARIVSAVISGQKLKNLIGTTSLPAPLTRRMCHIMVNPDRPQTIVRSARRAQVLAYGGSEGLARAVGDALNGFKKARLEQFWAEVIHWFCRQTDLTPDQVGPLCDYFDCCRRDDQSFQLKGRTLAAVTRDMVHWHRELADLQRFADKADFEPSGFASSLWKKTKNVKGKEVPYETWAMREICSPQQLITEGSAMNHCVAGYHQAIRSGRSSIWTLTMNATRRLTVEVRNRDNAVVQVRGKFNRLPRDRERAFVRRWAKKNGLEIVSYEM